MHKISRDSLHQCQTEEENDTNKTNTIAVTQETATVTLHPAGWHPCYSSTPPSQTETGSTDSIRGQQHAT